MTTEQIARKLEAVRNELAIADSCRTPSPVQSQIGAILIAISMLTDVIAEINAQQAATDRRIDAIGRSLRAIADRN